MVRALKNELRNRGYPCDGLGSLKAIIDSRLVPFDTIVEALSKALNIPLFDTFLHKITILEFSKVSEYSRLGYFICEDSAGKRCFVISNPLLLENDDILDKYKTHKMMLIKRQDFYDMLESAFSNLNMQKARLELGFVNPAATARNINYAAAFAKIIGAMIVVGYLSIKVFVALNYLIYLSQTLFKMWLFIDSSLALPSKKLHEVMESKDYPIYSILVPMYREEYGVKSILRALDQLDYPKNRLDIKLVVEADDEISLKILSMIILPEYVHVIKVPYSEPRTKPKALNYAMQYIRGEYVVIYDVEDRPDKDQLLKALDVFENASDDIVCVQAKLNFYNRSHNLLSRFFSIEYSLLFKFFLPGLDSGRMPIPLGGNSNHFRSAAVRELGLWDAYNVTEDADLGIRIFIYGYQTKVIDSYTMEEAPTDIGNWIHQRARWIKGFMQTFLVYWGQKPEFKANISMSGTIGIYLFLGFSTYSFFIMPWHLIAMLFNIDQSNHFFAELSGYITVLYMYITVSVIIILDTENFKNATLLDWFALCIWPLYFVLHIVASYKALWELLRKPFAWNKTAHKISEDG